MIRAIALFELRYQLRRPLWWIIALVFFGFGFACSSTFVIELAGATANVLRNAPVVIVTMLGYLSILGLLLNTAFVAGAILRDFDRRTHELIFSRPVRRLDYLLGRFAGSFLVSFSAFVPAAVGLAAGSLMPWIDPERLGPFLLAPYLWGLLVVALPNFFLLGAVFFCLASLTRSMLFTYLGMVGAWAGYFLSSQMRRDLADHFLSTLVDPFGVFALYETLEYWTAPEMNTLLPELGGVVLYNRLLWLGVGLGLLILALSCFRYQAAGGRRRRQRAAPGTASAAVGPRTGSLRLPRPERTFTLATAWRQLLHQTRVEVLGVLSGVPFLVILAFGVYKLVSTSRYVGILYGAPAYPLTHLMVATLGTAFGILLMIVVTFYAGELTWRERRLCLNEVFDAMPAPNGVFFGAKLMALLVAVVAFLGVGVVTLIGCQIGRGYYRLELPVYARGLVVEAMPFLFACFLALFLQVVAGRKFVGYLLMIPFLIGGILLAAFGFNHRLYHYGHTPAAPYSDMNGYGHFVAPLFWFNLYWAFGAAILVTLALLLWIRGTETGLRLRLRGAAQRFRGPLRVGLAVAAAGFLATGGWIFYNTNVLNEYLAKDEREARQADYEKKYRQYIDLPQPRLTDVVAEVDLFPHDRRLEIRGRYLLVNRHQAPIADLHCTIPSRVRVNSLQLRPHREILHDPVYGYRILRLDSPLAPGETMEMRFDLTVEHRGFVTYDPHHSETKVVYNGTFFYDGPFFPRFGYSTRPELQEAELRRKYGLPPVHPMAPVDDLFARRNQADVRDADWIHFETTISTDPEQIAIAPGYLQKEWTKGGRRYFHYRMDAPIVRLFSFQSGVYEVLRDRWGEVTIEIYHHPTHTYNLKRLAEAVKKTLAYCAAHFGPYQHRQMRIIEIPLYRGAGAMSFPNTVPFSETAGFITQVEGQRLDFPFYLTAHEVAHQWWGHQVVGGDVQGAVVLSETLAEYSALMVMEKEYGPEAMRRFLAYELDNYLFARSMEKVGEVPLMVAERQKHVIYYKGGLVMYALRDYMGEEALNRALARFVAEVKFQSPPYTTTRELLAHIRREMQPGQERLLTDFFETITLFDNEVAEASYTELPDGKYRVTLRARSHKLRADAAGVETEIPLDDWIDVGVFGLDRAGGGVGETVLFCEKRHLTAPETTFELVVDQRPVRAGIDPYNKLIDRDAHDNVKRVTRSAPAELGRGAAG